MSRDHHINYNSKLACLNCRKCWRKGIYARAPHGIPRLAERDLVCPQCRERLVNVGFDFKAPAQSDVRQWRKVEQLVRAGVLFHTRRFPTGEKYMAGPGPRPYSLREVAAFLEDHNAQQQRAFQQKQKQQKAVKRASRRGRHKRRLAGNEVGKGTVNV